MPIEGCKYLVLNDKLKALKTILERNDIDEIEIIKASSLSLEMRLMHNFISRIFLPRTDRFNQVSEQDLVFMEYLIKGEAISLSYIMICQMRETIRKVKTCPPYGMVFTLLFQDANIDLTGEDEKTLQHTNTYPVKSLQRMGYQFCDGS